MAIPNLNEEQKLACNRIVGAVQPVLSQKKFEQILSEILSSPNLLNQLHQVSSGEDLSQPNCIFLNAPGGTAKIYLIHTIQNCLKVRGRSVIALPSSTVAGELIKKGQDSSVCLHDSRSLRCRGYMSYICCLQRCSKASRGVFSHMGRNSNVSPSQYRSLGPYLKINHAQYNSIRRKGIVFAVEFWQILPVVSSGCRAQIVNACVKSSFLYNCFQTV